MGAPCDPGSWHNTCPSLSRSSEKPGRLKRPSANDRPRSSRPGFNRHAFPALGPRARCSGG
eukprot:1988338-Lingulodinium_polyedra.AAC.1